MELRTLSVGFFVYHLESSWMPQEDLSGMLPELSPGYSFPSGFSDQPACWYHVLGHRSDSWGHWAQYQSLSPAAALHEALLLGQ